jgi:hypothetical protein
MLHWGFSSTIPDWHSQAIGFDGLPEVDCAARNYDPYINALAEHLPAALPPWLQEAGVSMLFAPLSPLSQPCG